MSSKSEDLSPPTANQPTDITERVDINQMFTLIDGILPFEACLYYQVVPLSIQGSRLNLGMVNPSDRTASDYVRRLVSYINCSIVSLEISSDWHRDILSQYLSHTAKSQQQDTPTETPNQPIADNRSLPAPKDDPQAVQSTLVVDSPDVLPEVLESTIDIPSTQHQTPESTPPSPCPEVTSKPAQVSAGASAKFQNLPAQNQTDPLHLQLDPVYRTTPLKKLVLLSPKKLMQALLSRILDEGIGRLYFERSANKGRVLWSKDGVPQSILDDIQIPLFQGVINEFKRLTHLSLISVNSPKQVEIERLYEGNRLLLRFRVMPGGYGEEATLQVLRGAALKFHQQQQIDKLGRDALGIAQKLQQQINTIRDRARQDLNLSTNPIDALPAIVQMLKQMETQVADLLSEQEQNAAAKAKQESDKDA